MSITPSSILYEGCIGSSDDWQLWLNVSQEIIEQLKSQFVLRKISGSLSLRLDYVGLLCFKKRTFFALPKIYDGVVGDTTADLQTVFSCLQQYFARRKTRIISFGEAGEGTVFDDAGTILDLFLSLLRWTQEHGFYQAENTVRYDEFSHINWRQTISERFPVNFGSSVVYAEPIGYRSNRTPNQLTELQALALIDLADKVGPLSRIWLPLHDEIVSSAQEIIINSENYYGDNASMRNLIDELIFSSNKDFDRALLELLSMWIDSDFKANDLQLYGTNAFHVVWEDICVSLFLRHAVFKEHSQLASQPVLVSGKTLLHIGPQRPDILFEMDEDIWIADAKWYDFDKGDRPPLHDIVKQITYQTTVLSGKTVKNNLFLVPGMGRETWEHGGDILMQYAEKQDNRFPSIRIIRINWNSAVEMYFDAASTNWWQEFIHMNQVASISR